MIRNACIHISNEQPLLADLFDLPSASDAGLVCTNVRAMDGKRPVFIDSIAATFFFPYHVIRFLEIPEGAVEHHDQDRAADGSGSARRTRASSHEPIIASPPAPGTMLPVAVHAPDEPAAGDGELDLDLEIDEGFLQRIRDL